MRTNWVNFKKKVLSCPSRVRGASAHASWLMEPQSLLTPHAKVISYFICSYCCHWSWCFHERPRVGAGPKIVRPFLHVLSRQNEPETLLMFDASFLKLLYNYYSRLCDVREISDDIGSLVPHLSFFSVFLPFLGLYFIKLDLVHASQAKPDSFSPTASHFNKKR